MYIFIYDQKNNLGIDADGNKYEVCGDKVIDLSTKEEIPIDEVSLLEQLHPKAGFDPETLNNVIQVAFVSENGQWGGIPTVKVPLDFEELDEFKEVCAEYGEDTDSNNEEVFNTVGLTLKDTLVEYLSDQIYDKFYKEAQYWEFPLGVVDWDDMDADLDTLLIEYFTKYKKYF